MADPIDVHKPAITPLSPAAGGVPAQQARPGRSGFDGGSYFESGGRAPHRDQKMLHPPSTTGPKSSPSEVLARTLEVFKPLQGNSDFPARPASRAGNDSW